MNPETATEGGRLSKRRTTESPALSIASTLGNDERDDDGDNEGVNRDRFRERGADDHRGSDFTGGFRVSTEGFHSASDGEADANARAKRADSDRQGCTNSL